MLQKSLTTTTTLILPQYKFRNPLVIPHDDPFHFRLPSVAELIPYAIPDSCATMEAMDDADPVYACFGMIKIFPYFFNRWFNILSMNINFNNSKLATPVATCQRRIHHFSSLFLGLPCFPCSKSWRMTRFSLSSTLWVLVSEKCISTKYLVLSIFCCRQGVNRPVVLVWMLSLMFLLLGAKKTHGLQFTVPCAFTLFYWY